jgi:hypothetical protein
MCSRWHTPTHPSLIYRIPGNTFFERLCRSDSMALTAANKWPEYDWLGKYYEKRRDAHVSRHTPTLVLFSTWSIMLFNSENWEPMIFPAPAYVEWWSRDDGYLCVCIPCSRWQLLYASLHCARCWYTQRSMLSTLRWWPARQSIPDFDNVSWMRCS